MTIVRHIIRFAVAAIVLWIVGFIVPGFQVSGFWSALLAALVIAAIGWGVEAIAGRDISPFGRGVVGFLVSAAVIYVTQFIVGGVRASVIGALLAALAIGVVDLFIPTKVFATPDRNEDGRRD
ncbi:phage holin family protein [Numidum massiliense]|uniref:phage holin family protein n=1 Tax=Numidum massiliense TaxID=1522315 RepID=UPI0006D54182|nr:phage holin family protein [Numidum massiliense]